MRNKPTGKQRLLVVVWSENDEFDGLLIECLRFPRAIDSSCVSALDQTAATDATNRTMTTELRIGLTPNTEVQGRLIGG